MVSLHLESEAFSVAASRLYITNLFDLRMQAFYIKYLPYVQTNLIREYFWWRCV